MSTANACMSVDHTTKKWNSRTGKYDESRALCGKMTAPGQVLCPKHQLMESEGKAERERHAQKLRDKKALAEMLKDSPLRAYNPEFEDLKGGMYDRQSRLELMTAGQK